MQTRFLLLLTVTLLAMMGPMISTAIQKAGSCPDMSMPIRPLGICKTLCQTDSDCPDINKCCLNGCGFMTCSRPVS
uniref:Waprin n=1 Tax=Micrurus tener TaxID=1114301 RepID=A0A194AT36_9SAUR